MRADSQGLFWHDKDTKRIPRPPPPKRYPPKRTWEEADYLPRLEEARNAKFNLFTWQELKEAAQARETLLMDIELYLNYFLIAFTSFESGKTIYFEYRLGDWFTQADVGKLQYILEKFIVVTFNGNNFDIPILNLAMAGKSTDVLKEVGDAIIKFGARPYQILRDHKVKALKINHIDLIEVCPLQASLKLYAGRLHVDRMWDLPFKESLELTEDHITILRWYNINDLQNTAYVLANLQEQLELRASMSIHYGVDLRSKSDAQIAEAVIKHELTRINGLRPEKRDIEEGRIYKFNVPEFLKFESPVMQQALSTIRAANFVVSDKGSIIKPQEISDLKINIGGSTYQMGIGGLHSCEKKVTYYADDKHLLFDRDVSSYYPAIILNQRLFPEHLGKNFLTVYQLIVDRRLAAKKAGDKAVAEVLKIVVNGSFGKFGDPYSILYAPQLVIQTTITGQLSLLLLIERLEGAGIPVVSANTDGMLIHCPVHLRDVYKRVVAQWEKDINFQTEEATYASYHAKDVNNYLGIKPNGEVKGKGAYNNPWHNPTNDAKIAVARFHKNPVNTICIEAVTEYLTKGIPVTTTIRNCRDVTKFVSIRTVKGGAWKAGEYLGKAIRWYYAKGVTGEMVYALNGHKVPRSDGAKPIMDLPVALPSDIDYDWYIQEAADILVDIGAKPAPPPPPKTPRS